MEVPATWIPAAAIASAGFLFNLNGMVVMAVSRGATGFDLDTTRAQAVCFNHIVA